MIFVRFFITVLAVPICAYALPGMELIYIMEAMYAGALLGVVHTILRPIRPLMLNAFHPFLVTLMFIGLDTWLVCLATQIWPRCYQLDNILWAVVTAIIINVLREAISGATT